MTQHLVVSTAAQALVTRGKNPSYSPTAHVFSLGKPKQLHCEKSINSTHTSTYNERLGDTCIKENAIKGNATARGLTIDGACVEVCICRYNTRDYATRTLHCIGKRKTARSYRTTVDANPPKRGNLHCTALHSTPTPFTCRLSHQRMPHTQQSTRASSIQVANVHS